MSKEINNLLETKMNIFIYLDNKQQNKHNCKKKHKKHKTIQTQKDEDSIEKVSLFIYN